MFSYSDYAGKMIESGMFCQMFILHSGNRICSRTENFTFQASEITRRVSFQRKRQRGQNFIFLFALLPISLGHLNLSLSVQLSFLTFCLLQKLTSLFQTGPSCFSPVTSSSRSFLRSLFESHATPLTALGDRRSNGLYCCRFYSYSFCHFCSCLYHSVTCLVLGGKLTCHILDRDYDDTRQPSQTHDSGAVFYCAAVGGVRSSCRGIIVVVRNEIILLLREHWEEMVRGRSVLTSLYTQREGLLQENLN